MTEKKQYPLKKLEWKVMDLIQEFNEETGLHVTGFSVEYSSLGGKDHLWHLDGIEFKVKDLR